mmetsp:Transcript_40681/g.79650  ORF Transcript_40681/g.79650 Transcript_40681/m.79650 type:complete len:207 (+) Transcript_40681:1781-2401(+)
MKMAMPLDKNHEETKNHAKEAKSIAWLMLPLTAKTTENAIEIEHPAERPSSLNTPSQCTELSRKHRASRSVGTLDVGEVAATSLLSFPEVTHPLAPTRTQSSLATSSSSWGHCPYSQTSWARSSKDTGSLAAEAFEEVTNHQPLNETGEGNVSSISLPSTLSFPSRTKRCSAGSPSTARPKEPIPGDVMREAGVPSRSPRGTKRSV